MANTKITSDNLDTLTTLTVDDITLNGSTISGTGDITLDAVGDIILDADGDDIKIAEGGTVVMEIKHESSSIDFSLNTSDEDFKFKGIDGGSTITALTLDMSDAGSAYFNNKVGIGTTSPTGKLEIAATGTNAAPHIKLVEDSDTREFNIYNDGSGNGHLVLADSDDDTPDTEIVLADNGVIQFKTGNTERMTITADGNLGLGDNSPANFSGYVVASLADSTGAILDFKTTGSEGVFARIQGAVNNGLFITNEQNYPIALNTNATERMRVTGAGKVIIGDTASHVDDLLQIETPASGGGHGIQIRRNDSNGDQGIGRIMFGNNNDTDLATVSAITDGQADSARLVFSTQTTSGSSTERMRITSTGLVQMNGATGSFTSPSFPDGILYTYKTDNEPHIENKVNHTNSFGLYKFNNSNGAAGSISMFSTSVSYNTSSDYRLKEDVNYTWDATSKLKQLKPCEFKFKADSDDVVHQGFLAHEVDDIVPTSVFGEKDGKEMQQLDHSKLVPLLVKTIQELEHRLKILEG